jgi:HlyD family secretion protein
MRRRSTGTVLSILVVGILLAGCGGREPDTGQNLRRGVVERGSIDSGVDATGSLLPAERVNLSFEQPGVVREVFVEVGDVVTAGQPLARLDTEALELAVQQAELALQAQQLAYQRLFLPPSQAQIAAARAAVESAVAAYNRQRETADPETVRIAQLQYEQAFNAYQQADMQLRAVQWYLSGAPLLSVQEQVDQALFNVEIARLRLEQLRAEPDQYALGAAQATVYQAQAELNRLLEGPSDLEIARAQIQIDQAQIALERSRQRLDAATLIAPFTGVVSAVNVHPGMVAPTSSPAFVLIDDSHLYVEVDVDEVDIGRVTPGQPVQITLDALPSETIEGQVTSIAPSATGAGGAVTYRVRIDLAQTDLPLRAGMTATANIIVQRLEGILLAPNWAIRIDRATGQAYLSVLTEDGSLQEVPVVLGLRGDVASQIVAGVEEGQVVAVSLAGQSLNLFGGQ